MDNKTYLVLIGLLAVIVVLMAVQAWAITGISSVAGSSAQPVAERLTNLPGMVGGC
ncbi:MAG: hypothetical protein PWP76_74 [Candidatus Diapherotrites archaeon]|nr:hypothetical protein [Candidatus Diapherotrites archaeon]